MSEQSSDLSSTTQAGEDLTKIQEQAAKNTEINAVGKRIQATEKEVVAVEFEAKATKAETKAAEAETKANELRKKLNSKSLRVRSNGALKEECDEARRKATEARELAATLKQEALESRRGATQTWQNAALAWEITATEWQKAEKQLVKQALAWEQTAESWGYATSENAIALDETVAEKLSKRADALRKAAECWEAAAAIKVQEASNRPVKKSEAERAHMYAKRFQARAAEAQAEEALLIPNLKTASDYQQAAAKLKEEATAKSKEAAQERAKEKREEYYEYLKDDAKLIRFVERTPDKARPKKHTMGREHFLTYIGRFDTANKRPVRSSNEILCKKFSSQQKRWLQIAYHAGLIVRIVGAPVNDYDVLLQLRKRQGVDVDPQSIPKLANTADAAIPAVPRVPGLGERYERISAVLEKPFNRLRAQMLWTAPVASHPQVEEAKSEDAAFNGAELPLPAPDTELWILVFPSPQYVDQVAELVQAILDDMHKWRVARNDRVSSEEAPRVRVWHFEKLEKQVARWSGLDGSLPLYIRHGDVVAIGNVDLLLPGIELVGYKRKFADWEWFGLNNMFGIQILVNTDSNSRIVLLGVTECFWGEASARYVEALLQVGARHILYGSKAATMIDRESISEIKSPGSFSIYVRHGENQGLTQLNSTLTAAESLRHLAELASIRTAGVGVTVPTVIGENHDQRDRLKDLNPSTMDDEDGYIAQVIQEHNRRFQSTVDQAGFIPVHYISDYIHQRGEVAGKKQQGLANTRVEERNARFAKIGSFFGVYATIYGLREYVPLPKSVSHTYLVGASVELLIERVQPFLDAGMIREAIATLTGSARVLQLPIANLQAIVLLCQKYGFLDDALHALQAITKNENVHWAAQSPEDRLRMEIVRLKLDTQAGRFEEAELIVENIENNFPRLLEKNRQYSAFCRRKAIIHAFMGKAADAQQWFDIARAHEKGAAPTPEQDATSTQDRATNDLYQMIAMLAPGMITSKDWEARLIQVRQDFLTIPLDKAATKDGRQAKEVWGTNPEKSALTALFVEAALHLVAWSNDDYRGMVRLAVAHLYNIGIGGSERSEGYGELIAFIQDPALKALFRRAIRMDGGGRRDFQRLLQLMHLWPQVQDSLKIFKLDLSMRAKALQDELETFDNKFSGSAPSGMDEYISTKEESNIKADVGSSIDSGEPPRL